MPPVRAPFLGELELAVLDHLWTHTSGDAKAVHHAIGRKRRITLNTIQSTLKRLAEKGLLSRTKVSHAHVYAPRVGRDDFNRRVIEGVVAQVMDGAADAMIAAFVDVTERAGAEHLARLERLVAARLARAAKDPA